jgi:AraC family transcriptional regulator of adaptative response / DNA-3-methyladenine glycosylase II
VALHKALGVLGARDAAKSAQAASQSWKPWRSYSVIRAWTSMSQGAKK